LLAAVLVTLNVALWLTPAGFALRQVALPQLFGKNLLRADVVDQNGEWRVDRGVITSVSLTSLTLKEADTHVQTIALSPTTKVTGLGKALTIASLAKGWRVLVTWPANGAADVVKVEKRSGKAKGEGGDLRRSSRST
jgi:hypothetical protein